MMGDDGDNDDNDDDDDDKFYHVLPMLLPY